MTAPLVAARGAGSLIAFSGVDYAGKSTQIDLLVSALGRQGVGCRVKWFRPGYGPELDALRGTLRRLRPNSIPSPGDTPARVRAFRRPGVAEAWVAMACADTLLQYAIKIRSWVSRGDVVVCDRFIQDAVIDLELRFPEVMRRAGPGVAACLRWCPTPDAHFLLMIDEVAARARMELKQEPFPDTLELRGQRRALYQTWAERGTQVVLDGSRPSAVIHEDIVAMLRDLGVIDAGR